MKATLLFFITVCICIGSQAQTVSGKRMLIHGKDRTMHVYDVKDVDSITFAEIHLSPTIITVNEVSGSSAKIKVTLPDNALKCAVAAIPDDGSINDIKDYIAANHQIELKESADTVLRNLKSGTKYLAATLTYDKYEVPTTVSSVAFSTPSEAQFSITVDDISWGDARVTITPSNADMRYYYYCMPMSKVNTLQGGINGIMKFDYDFWQMQADMYGMTVNEVIQEQLTSGTQTFRTSEISGMAMWNTESMVYCYGMDGEGNVLTPLTYQRFTTSKPIPSNNTFDIQITNVTPTSVEATITPSNNDRYFIAVQRKKFVDFYAEKTDTMAYSLLSNNYNNPDAFATGVHQVKKEDFTLNGNQDYFLIVFGVNNGLSTPVKMVPFKTLRSSSSAIMAFESYFCNDQGAPNLDKLQALGNKSFRYSVANEQVPCNIFTDLTSVVTTTTASYHYTYDAGDNQCSLEINGTKEADKDGVYATLKVNIPSHPDISTIFLVKDK